jgi:preprotein translocase SecE subunit
MAEKKKQVSRSQMAEAGARGPEKAESAKTSQAERNERKGQQKVQSKAVRREGKSSSSWILRVRNSRVGRFVYEAYYELRYKVTWPTFIEARNMTVAVIVLSVLVGLLLGLADFGLLRLFVLITGAK